MIYLCEALVDNHVLTSLTVWNNGITQDSSLSLNQVLVTIAHLHYIIFFLKDKWH